MIIQQRKPIFDESYSDNRQLFTWSAVAILSATFFLRYHSFMTLFKHNITNPSTYSETYFNGLQNDMLAFFRALFKLKPQLIFDNCIIYFFQKSKILIYFKHKDLYYNCLSRLN